MVSKVQCYTRRRTVEHQGRVPAALAVHRVAVLGSQSSSWAATRSSRPPARPPLDCESNQWTRIGDMTAKRCPATRWRRGNKLDVKHCTQRCKTLTTHPTSETVDTKGHHRALLAHPHVFGQHLEAPARLRRCEPARGPTPPREPTRGKACIFRGGWASQEAGDWGPSGDFFYSGSRT